MADDNDKMDISGDPQDEDFDYQKEIEEIEMQEKELRAKRAQKQRELEARRKAREAGQSRSSADSRRDESRVERDRRERKKESEWLGEPFDDEDIPGVSAASAAGRSSKKRGRKGLVAVIVILLLIALGGGAYAFKTQADKKTVSDFQAKVSAFQTEKLDGANLGSDASYFEDFMKQCQDAIKTKNISKINTLNKEWADVEKKLSSEQTGKASMDAFAKTVTDTLAKYQTTDDTKSQYDKFMSALKQAQADNDYSKIDTLQSDLDKLVTALKAADIKQVQTLKNSISAISLDKKYVTSAQQKQLDSYSTKTSTAEKNADYATAISTLQKWLSAAQQVSSSADAQKKESVQKASSEAAAVQQSKTAAESKAAAAAESTAQSIAESKKAASSTSSSSSSSSSSKSSSSGTYSSLTANYVFSGSSSSYLTKSDLKGKSSLQLKVARNEIYARHGRKFDDASLQAYFNSKSWYKGTVSPNNFSDTVFNKYEKANIMLINDYENN